MTAKQFCEWLSRLNSSNGGLPPAQDQWTAVVDHLGEVVIPMDPLNPHHHIISVAQVYCRHPACAGEWWCDNRVKD